ncbi:MULTISPECIES: hypothetical protein [unclassified Rhizobium]|uniref:hypothetical protein n=1 Tax=unclassified Rhizobium TaxID=2613769 RepID=UPI002169E88D|nr:MULTISPECIES: hypothetical protein [unclassified Rhizobium]MCS3741639.1 hypothetical protein [Rhizobium sp. BK661]MCS4093638.1 hypothetical protein [Rhizobium sp. BK176]
MAKETRAEFRFCKARHGERKSSEWKPSIDLQAPRLKLIERNLVKARFESFGPALILGFMVVIWQFTPATNRDSLYP